MFLLDLFILCLYVYRPVTLQRKRRRLKHKREIAEKQRQAAAEYALLLSKYISEKKAKKAEIKKRRSLKK